MKMPAGSARVLGCLTSAVGVFLCWSPPAGAQTAQTVQTALIDLPDSPDIVLAQQSSSAHGASTTAIVSGVVLDRTGAAISNAQVTLVVLDGSATTRSVTTGIHGDFSFTSLAHNSYRLTVKASGFQSASSGQFTLTDDQSYIAPDLTLSLAETDTEVDVLANDPKVADLQIKAEEKQRVLGIVPNFYISYVHDPVAMNTKQKYRLALRDTFDPIGFVGTAIGAEVEQLNKNFPGYGYGVSGYAKRYAALYGDGLTGDLLSHAVFPSIFHQDPRYVYQGTGTIKSRLKHAISFAVITRGDDGRTVPNYSYVLGDLGSGALSNLYYPHADRGVGLVFINAALGIAGQAGGSVAEEFLSRFVTTNVPKQRP